MEQHAGDRALTDPCFMTPTPSPNTPEFHDHLVWLQGQAVDVLSHAERQELSAQFQADGRRQVLTAELTARRRDFLEAQAALAAWTKVVQSLGGPAEWASLPENETPGTPDDLRCEGLATELVDLHALPVPPADVSLVFSPSLLDPPLEFDLDVDLEEVADGWTEDLSLWDAPERVSQWDHARSSALELVTLYHWESGLEALTEVLNRPRWGQLRTNIERLIRQGMTPAEFELGWALRTHFRDQLELNVVPCRRPFQSYFDTPGLRWSVALTLARRFPGHDAELLLTRLVAVGRSLRPEDRRACWSDRLEQLMEALPEDVDGDYWLSVLEERA